MQAELRRLLAETRYRRPRLLSTRDRASQPIAPYCFFFDLVNSKVPLAIFDFQSPENLPAVMRPVRLPSFSGPLKATTSSTALAALT